jgi:adenylate cyclase
MAGELWWERLSAPADDTRPPGRARFRRSVLAVIAVLSSLAVLALSATPQWRLLELRAFDYLSTFAPPPRPADSPIVVAIDEPSMAELGRQWPWPRDIHARLVTALRAAGARAIGLDIIFAEPSSEAADAALAEALGPDVVLAGDETLIETAQASQLIRVEPLPRFTAAGARTGIAAIALDPDGVLRRVPRYPDGFAAALIETRGGKAGAIPAGALIQAYGGPRSHETVSYYQALDPETFLPPDTFRGRTVIVGLSLQNAPTTQAGGADAYATPHTVRDGRLVAGAEIQATILDNLAGPSLILPAGSRLQLAAVAFGAALAAFAVWRTTGWRTLIAAAAAGAALVAGSALALRYGRIYLAPAGPALAFTLVTAAQAARDYAAERKLRQGITRAFSRYLSPALVDRLASDPTQLRLGGEVRTLSILFCDVRGFTSVAERMKSDPEGLTRLVNRLLSPLSEVVLSEGGTIDKYIGDCIMAFWNAPLADPAHAQHAISAACKMLDALDALNEELAAEARQAGSAAIRLRVGIGVNTGECVVGNMGSSMRFDYSALGDAVNLASRLENASKEYRVPLLIGEDAMRAASGHFTFVELDRVAVKGRTTKSPVFTILRGAPGAAIDLHIGLLNDRYAGRPIRKAQLDEAAAALPQLADYYATIEPAAEPVA